MYYIGGSSNMALSHVQSVPNIQSMRQPLPIPQTSADDMVRMIHVYNIQQAIS